MTYKADSLHLDFLKLAQSGHQLISVIGELEWKCRDIGPGSPMAFKSGASNDNYLVTFQSTISIRPSCSGVEAFYRLQPKQAYNGKYLYALLAFYWSSAVFSDPIH